MENEKFLQVTDPNGGVVLCVVWSGVYCGLYGVLWRGVVCCVNVYGVVRCVRSGGVVYCGFCSVNLCGVVIGCFV